MNHRYTVRTPAGGSFSCNDLIVAREFATLNSGVLTTHLQSGCQHRGGEPGQKHSHPPTVCYACGEQKPHDHIWTSFSTVCLCEECLTELYHGMRDLREQQDRLHYEDYVSDKAMAARQYHNPLTDSDPLDGPPPTH